MSLGKRKQYRERGKEGRRRRRRADGVEGEGEEDMICGKVAEFPGPLLSPSVPSHVTASNSTTATQYPLPAENKRRQLSPHFLQTLMILPGRW
jgi:hypothetical protein